MEPKPKNTSQRTSDQRARLRTIPGALMLFGLGLEACATRTPGTNRRLEQPAPGPIVDSAPTPVFEGSYTSEVDKLFYGAATAQPQKIPEYFFTPTENFSQEDFELARKSVLKLELFFKGADEPIPLSAVVSSLENGKLELITSRHAFLSYALGAKGLAEVRRPHELTISRPDLTDQAVRSSMIESIKYGPFESGSDIAVITVDISDQSMPFDVEPTPYLTDYQANLGQPIMILGYPVIYYLYNSNKAALAANQGTISKQTDLVVTTTLEGKQTKTVYSQLLCGNAPSNGGMSGGGMFIKEDGILYCVGINSLIYNQISPVTSCSAFIPKRDLLKDM